MDGLVACALFALVCASPWIVKWFWLHPHVNRSKMKDNLNEASKLQERVDMAQELLLDINLKTMERYNIRSKGIRIIWADSVNSRDKELTFYVDGKTEMTKALRELAKAVERDADKQLMKRIYKLPKRHGKDDVADIIRIHGLKND